MSANSTTKPSSASLILRREAERRGLILPAVTAPAPPPIRIEQLKIRNKKEQIVNLIPNEIQSAFLNEVVPRWQKGDYTPTAPRRDNVLKFRQPGFSTIIQALLYCWATSRPGCRVWTVAADDDGAKLLWRMIEIFYQTDVRRESGLHPLSTRYDREGWIQFEGFASEIKHTTCSKVALGRGTTLSALHLSELAWWPTYATRGGLLQAVPAHGHVFEETTARGFNEYQKKYDADKRGETGFRAWFFRWNLFPEYSAPAPEDFQPSPEERKLADTYALTDGQLQWRRIKKKELGETEDTPFEQEYPLTDREAFVATGNPVFNRQVLTLWEQRLERVAEVPRPVFETRGGRRQFWQRLRQLHGEGFLRVWEEPDEDNFYLVTADPAGGVNADGKRDFCVASAWTFSRFRPLEQVAQVRGHWEPHEFAWIMAELAAWYSGATTPEDITAMLCPLRLNHGESVWNTLVHEIHVPQNRGNGWGGLYYHDPTDINERANPLAPDQRTPGFPEGGGGKGFMIGVLQEEVSEDTIIVNSRQTVTEMFRYIDLPGGGMGGESGSKDDCVSEAGCAAAVYRLRGKHAAPSRHAQRHTPPQTYGGYGNVFGR